MRESEVKKEAAIELRVFGSFAKIEPLWASLEGWQDHPSLWPAWLSAMEETGCVAEKKGWVPYHLGMFDGGELLAAAPCYVKLNSEGEFIFDHGLARSAPRFGVDYFPKLLVASPFTPTNGPRLLVAKGKDPERARHVFAAALASLTGELEVSSAHTLFLPEADAVSLADKGLLHRYSVQFHFTNPGFESYEDFLKTLPSKRRTQLRRERRYPSEQGITIETETGDALTADKADAMYRLYLTTVDKFMWGRRYLNREFFEAIFASMPQGIEMVSARAGKKLIAGALNLRGKNAIYGRYWGAHAEVPFLHFNVCYYHTVERTIREGIALFEPGAGGEHKSVRGFHPTITHSVHHIREPRFALAIADFFERERIAIRAELDADTSSG